MGGSKCLCTIRCWTTPDEIYIILVGSGCDRSVWLACCSSSGPVCALKLSHNSMDKMSWAKLERVAYLEFKMVMLDLWDYQHAVDDAVIVAVI